MGHEDYWVAISREGNLLGGGFFVNSSYVLTSTACIPGLRARDPVDLHTAQGLPLRAMVFEVAEDAGLALLSVLPDPEADFAPLQAGNAVKGDPWRAPFRPDPLKPVLRGTVDAVVADRRDGDGRPLDLIELAADPPPGGYERYVGGPVERRTEGQAPSVLGILLDAEASGRLSDTGEGALVACAIDCAFELFERLSAEYLVGMLGVGLGKASDHRRSKKRKALEAFETGRFLAREMDALAAENPLLARDMEPYYMRLANEVCDEALGAVYGEPDDD